MAEYEERSLDDLTEEATQHKLDELREKGQVAQSRELTGALVLIAVMVTLYFLSNKFIGDFSTLMRDIFSKDLAKPMEIYDWRSFSEIGGRCLRLIAVTFLPIGLAAIVLGVLGSVAQIGFVFSSESLSPDFNRLNPVSGFMKIFSMKSVTELVKTLLKFGLVGGVVYLSIKAQMVELPNIVSLGASQLISYIGATTTRVFGVVAIFLLGASGIDYFIQWRRFQLQARMTKAEAKKDMREREGDPQIKARVRVIQREMARKRMMKAIPTADVVITNPTHIAIAIIYDVENGFAPKVVAKGADFLAERIKKIARENNVPTVENKPLARTLYKHVKVGQMIPRSLYQAVAEILAYVYKLKGRRIRQPDETRPS